MRGKTAFAAAAAALIVAASSMPALAAHARTPQKIWDSTCAACHTNGPGPQILGMHLPADQIKSTVRYGGVQMTGFSTDQISDAELDALAKWVHEHDAPKSN